MYSLGYNMIAAVNDVICMNGGIFMNFHTVFKDNRKKLGYTQEDIAIYLNVTPQAVSKWETGQGTPDLSLIVPIAQLFNITTDELLGNAKDDIMIGEELNEIKSEKCDLLSKYDSYIKLLKCSPSNIEILKSCIHCAYSLLAQKKRYSLDSVKIDELLSDMEKYRKMLKESNTAIYNEMATGKLAEAYISCEKYDKAKEIIKDSTPFQWYNQDRLNGHLYYRMSEYPKARENYALSLSSSFDWMLRDIISIGCTYADFRGQNIEKYYPDKLIKVFKYVYDLIKVVCNNTFPYPYQKWYLNVCEFLAQAYTDIGEYDIAINYLAEFVDVCEEWKKLSGTKAVAEDYCFLLTAHPKEMLLPVPDINRNYIETVFNRNKYKRYNENPLFVSLKTRIEKLLQ